MPPDNCCCQGCDNCVWIQYCEELVEYFQDGGDRAKKEIDQLIDDPSLKMFIKMELAQKLKDL